MTTIKEKIRKKLRSLNRHYGNLETTSEEFYNGQIECIDEALRRCMKGIETKFKIKRNRIIVIDEKELRDFKDEEGIE